MRGLLSTRRYEAIKREVIFMFEECGVDRYPIDPFFIAGKLQYVLRPYSCLGQDMLLKSLAESPDAYSTVELNPETGMLQYVIYYNDRNSCVKRIRWTLFHEIAHCYLGHHDHRDNSRRAVEEAEANFFAKYTIAPPPLIHALGLWSGNQVAHTFLTSREAGKYCYAYYQKWLRKGTRSLTDYERHLLSLFHMNVA